MVSLRSGAERQSKNQRNTESKPKLRPLNSFVSGEPPSQDETDQSQPLNKPDQDNQ